MRVKAKFKLFELIGSNSKLSNLDKRNQYLNFVSKIVAYLDLSILKKL
jgi:hypothetical protein